MGVRAWYVCEICGARFQVVVDTLASLEDVKCINPHDDEAADAPAKPE